MACNAVHADDITISEESRTDGMALVTQEDGAAPFVIDAADAEVVATAAQAVCGDIETVTGVRPAVLTSIPSAGTAVIAGTIGQSSLIDGMVESGRLDVSGIKGKWEAFGLQMVENPVDGLDKALVVFGSTPRGTAYALFEISRLAGVSPFIWWADVAPQKRQALHVGGDRTLVGEPSVKYRGIFINDEDWGIWVWAKDNFESGHGNMGPKTYAKVMELLLRLRANTLWPAMHHQTEAFWANKDNLPVARKYDIMLGSSHCEQMLRDNLWEWDRYGGHGNSDFNYATNKAMVQKYWADRVGESRGYDAIYTLGMRGVHDEGINGYPTTADKVRGLTEIIAYQRQLLADSIGDPTTIPQAFIPYKEVLDAYNAGLKVPDDVTLLWVDDNHGYIRQLPTDAEQARSGGNGIYYHLSYLGTPASYLWLSSISPSLISYELTKGYRNGMDTQWIINVGDIKPAEAELEFCMELAWDIDRWTPENAWKFTRYWMAKTFGEQTADELAAIKEEYYRLAASGKPEHIFKVSYTMEEMDSRIAAYEELVSRVENIRGSVPAALQDAFYEMIEYPVKAAYYMNVKTFRAAQSITWADAGDREKAMACAAEARAAYRQIDIITRKYNNETAGGKWRGMMSWKPNGGTQFNMPETATISSVSKEHKTVAPTPAEAVPATGFKASGGNLTVMRGLGISGASLTVWPMDMTAYGADRLDSAPYAEYEIAVRRGINTIEARCLPTFPVNAAYDLRIAISVDGGEAEIRSLKTTAMEGKWNKTSIQGYNEGAVVYDSDSDKTVTVRVWMLDPGVVLSEIYSTPLEGDSDSLTSQLLTNPDFEYDHDGNLNPEGETRRGVPYGWQADTSRLNGESWGINNDGGNYHGNNLCWFLSRPFPADFELSQTVSADKLEPGIYRVTCRLWVEKAMLTNCRLFANNNVQYFGKESDYTNVLTPGENNTYAGYDGGDANSIVLRNMAVYIEIKEGEDLKIGIRTGNRRNDGSYASDNSGWFKVDDFRIEKTDAFPDNSEEDLTLTEKLITNYDFELYDDNGTIRENTSGQTRRYTPYGWHMNGSFPGDSYGLNNDAANPHGTNACWFQPHDDYMPDGFQLSQTIKAESLTPGRYLIQCKLWVEEGLLSNTRLFANDDVQYYGMDYDYRGCLTDGENNTFAGYIGGQSGNYVMQDMWVYTDISEGEDLTLGIRSGNYNPDGTPGTVFKNGWFKVDYFRINKVTTDGITSPVATGTDCNAKGVYTIDGRRLSTSADDMSSLPKGVYIVDGKKKAVR